jgi:cytochrome c oxidase cbb3-type subunit IV
MDKYTFLRELADSWFLLAMFGFFVGVILWAFRPGSTATYDQVANIPMRDDDAQPANGRHKSAEGACDV